MVTLKSLSLALLLVGCSSWKHKDFEKELDKSANPPEPQVQVDEALKEKFEIQPVEEAEAPAPEVKTDSKKKPKVSAKKPKAVVKQAPKAAPVVKQPLKPEYPADYPEELKALNARAKAVWSQYKPNHEVNRKMYLDINYLGMTVGKIMFTNKGKKMINDKEVWHLHARFKSAPFYSNIYELDDTVDTYVTTDQFLSQRYSLIQRESKQSIDDLQLHDRDQLKTFWFYKEKRSNGETKNKEKTAFIPHFSIDPFSVLFFYQGLPLKNGDVYEIPVINKGKILILKAVVEGREKIETEKGNRNAIRVHATTQYTGAHLKSGNLYFWFSDDSERILLRAQAKIKIGSVTADIVED